MTFSRLMTGFFDNFGGTGTPEAPESTSSDAPSSFVSDEPSSSSTTVEPSVTSKQLTAASYDPTSTPASDSPSVTADPTPTSVSPLSSQSDIITSIVSEITSIDPTTSQPITDPPISEPTTSQPISFPQVSIPRAASHRSQRVTPEPSPSTALSINSDLSFILTEPSLAFTSICTTMLDGTMLTDPDQIFVYLPVINAAALKIDVSQVNSWALQVYVPSSYRNPSDSTQLGIMWLGYIPSDFVDTLAAEIKIKQSSVYSGVPDKALASHVNSGFNFNSVADPSALGSGSGTNVASTNILQCPQSSHHARRYFRHVQHVDGAQAAPLYAPTSWFRRFHLHLVERRGSL
ncbi:hypothetical protein Hypma_003392, partial [Hypsizygus marmoreus]